MRKVYVGVNAAFSPEGIMVPLSLVWENGRRYEVDRMQHFCRDPLARVGGSGVRYTVRVLGRKTHIWYDELEHRWFMEGK